MYRAAPVSRYNPSLLINIPVMSALVVQPGFSVYTTKPLADIDRISAQGDSEMLELHESATH